MKTGAYEFLTKPVDPDRILQAVSEALQIAGQNMAADVREPDAGHAAF